MVSRRIFHRIIHRNTDHYHSRLSPFLSPSLKVASLSQALTRIRREKVSPRDDASRNFIYIRIYTCYTIINYFSKNIYIYLDAILERLIVIIRIQTKYYQDEKEIELMREQYFQFQMII